MSIRRAVLLLLLLIGCSAPAAGDVSIPGGDWATLAVYHQREGLPQNSVYAVVQTRDGYIWAATKGGLARFDGDRFTTFDNRHPNQLRDNEVWDLVEGDDGSLWIGTYGGGLSRYQNGRFTTYTRRNGLVNEYVSSLAKGRDGAIWIGTDGGLSRFADGRFTNYTAKDGLASDTVRAVYSDTDGSIWVGYQKGGLTRFLGGRFVPYAFVGPAPSSETGEILRDRSQALWLATSQGLFRVKDGRSVRYTTADGLSSDWIYRVYEDPQGTLWIGTDRGLDRYVDGRFVHVDRASTTLDNVSAMICDREGTLWIGSQGDGLSRLRQAPFTSYTVENGLASDYVTTVFHDRQENTWIGTSRGLTRLKDGELTSYSISGALGGSRITAIAQDAAGQLWVAAQPGLYRFDVDSDCRGRNCRYRFVPMPIPGIVNTVIRTMFQGRDGTLWLGTNFEGLVKYQGRDSRVYTTKDGLSHDAVRGIVEDREGALWIATRGGGLNRLKGDTFTVYTERDGLANNNLQALSLDAQGTLWIATRSGINRFKEGKFVTYTVNDGLYANHVYGFVEDDHGNLWMNCSQGVFRVSQRQLDDFAAGRIRSIASQAYGLEDGLKSTVGSVGHSPVGHKSADGRVWFAMLRGVSVVHPQRVAINALPPPVRIEELSADQRQFDVAQPVLADPGRGDLAIRYTALSFIAPEKVSFRYKLEGYDSDWVNAGERRAAYYNNIPPGRYTFRVMAANNDGVWNEQGDAVSIELPPHIYQTRAFYGASAVVLLLLVFALHRMRMHRLGAREQELIRVVDARTKALKDEVLDRRRAEVAMRDSEARSTALLSAIPDLMFRIRRDGVFLDYRTGSDEQGFLEAGDLVGRHMTDVLPPAVALQVSAAIDRALDARATESVEYELETSGSIRVFESRIAVCGLDDVVLISRDITESRTLTLQLHQAQKLEAIGQLAAGIAHEINTPTQYVGDNMRFIQDAVQDVFQVLQHYQRVSAAALTPPVPPSLLAELDAAVARADLEFLSSEIPHAFGAALDGTKRIAKIVQSMKDFAHPGSTEKCASDLNRAIEGAATVSASEWKYVAEMVLDLDPGLPLVSCLLAEFNQVLLNLIVNAAHAIAEADIGKRPGTITIRSRRLDDWVEIRISDTGTGIPEAVRARVFDPFFTTKPVGKGTGQGLAIAHTIVVQQHGGTIGLESTVGLGTTFTIRLPQAPTPRERAPETGEAGYPLPAGPPTALV